MLKGTQVKNLIRVNLFRRTLFVWPGLSFYSATDLFTSDWVDNPIWVHPDRCITGSKLNSPFIDVIGNKNKDLKREEQSVCDWTGKNTKKCFTVFIQPATGAIAAVAWLAQVFGI